FFFHSCNRRFHTRRIPKLKRPEFPIEPHAHGTINFDDRVRNFRYTIGGVIPKAAKRRPEKWTRLVSLLRTSFQTQQHPQSRSNFFYVLCHFERSKPRLFLRTILQRLPVEHQSLLVVISVFRLLVEAASRFVSQPLAFQHLLEEVRKRCRSGFLLHAHFFHVPDHVSENIQPNQINRAKRCRLGPADRLPREGIHFFY